VLPAIEPGSVAAALPVTPPEMPESLDAMLDDTLSLIVPHATQWQHPGFFAYFASTASGPGILGEMLVAALGQNPMLWRTSPSGTELEGVVVDWLRQAARPPRAAGSSSAPGAARRAGCRTGSTASPPMRPPARR